MALEVFCVATGCLKFKYECLGKVSLPSLPHSPPFRIFFSPTHSPVSASFMAPQGIWFWNPCSKLLGCWDCLYYVTQNKWSNMRLPPFLFSFSASNRVIHISSCSLPLCFVYQTSYGMKRKVRDGEICSEENSGKEVSAREGSRGPETLGRGTTHWAPGSQQSCLGNHGTSWVSWET